MSVLFQLGEAVLWSPSPRLAQLFLSQVRAAEEAIATASGIGDLVADEVRIEPWVLQEFVSALALQVAEGSNAIAASLYGGVFAVSCGLLAMCVADSDLPELPVGVGPLARRGIRMVGGHGQPRPIFSELQGDSD